MVFVQERQRGSGLLDNAQQPLVVDVHLEHQGRTQEEREEEVEEEKEEVVVEEEKE